MDWRDFMRGFFGGSHNPPPPRSSRGHDDWPPPPPVSDFFQRDNGKEGDKPSGSSGGRNHYNDNDQGEGNQSQDDLFQFPRNGFGGNNFVFGDIFSMMGEMFREIREMEKSINDFNKDAFFGENQGPGFGRMLPSPGSEIDPDSSNEKKNQSQGKPSDNVRDLVLKKPEGKSSSKRHYISEPKSSQDKVDRDLDELYQKSMLDLSELPVPSSEESNDTKGKKPTSRVWRMVPFGFGGGNNDGPGNGSSFSSSFQKTYQTFSYKNGRWEGEIVKEDPNGKSVTRYYQDENGDRKEETEYFPGEKSSWTTEPEEEVSSRPSTSLDDHFGNFGNGRRHTTIFEFLDRFFRPRM